jgi:hypothetical protein
MPVLGPRAKRRRVGLASGSEPDLDPPTPWPLEDLEHELGLLARFEAEAAEDECQRHSLCEQPVRSCGDPPPITDDDEAVAAAWWGGEGPLG